MDHEGLLGRIVIGGRGGDRRARQPVADQDAPSLHEIDFAGCVMVFTKHLREGVRRGRIRCSVRIWKSLHVRVGGRYPMDEGHIVVDSVDEIERADITDSLARESGFKGADDLIQTASHGSGSNVYLIRFHYLPPGAWDVAPTRSAAGDERPALLRRIRSSTPPASRRRRKAAP